MVTKTQKTVDKANQELQRVRDAIQTAKDDLAARIEALATIEKGVGQRLFDARLAKDAKKESAINAELDAARQAVETSRLISKSGQESQKTAHHVLYEAEAVELREQVSKLWPAVKKRIVATRILLDELAKVEDVSWMPFPWATKIGVFKAGSWSRTKTGELLFEIVDLERRASIKETQAEKTPLASILIDSKDEAGLHLGCEGVLNRTMPIAVPVPSTEEEVERNKPNFLTSSSGWK